MSATQAPALSLASAPSSAGSQLATRLAAYPGRKKRSHPEKTPSSCSCQPTPSPVRNAWMTFCVLNLARLQGNPERLFYGGLASRIAEMPARDADVRQRV